MALECTGCECLQKWFSTDPKFYGLGVILCELLTTMQSGGAITQAVSTTGQVVIEDTGVAVQLPSAALVNGVVIKAYSENSDPILVGDASVTNAFDGTGNGDIIEPGERASYGVPNLDVLYINGTAGDFISYGAS